MSDFLLFFFFSLNVAVIFSHTFQTWSHSTRLQTTESHTHVSFPQRRTNTDAARVGRGLEASWRHPLLILGSCPKADPSLSNPKLVQFSIFFLCFSFFLAKVNLSNHRNQTSVPLEQLSNPIARINVGIVHFCKSQTCWNLTFLNNVIRLRWRSFFFYILLNISGVVAINVAGKCSSVSLDDLTSHWKYLVWLQKTHLEIFQLVIEKCGFCGSVAAGKWPNILLKLSDFCCNKHAWKISQRLIENIWYYCTNMTGKSSDVSRRQLIHVPLTR